MNTRISKLIFPAILFLFACLIAFGENGPTPKVVVGSSGISDGSVTPAKISSGYDLLTTAEKTQALTGSSTVDFAAKNIVSNGNLETAYSGRSSVFSPKIQFRSEMSATVATYTVATFTTVSGAEGFTYYGKILVRGQTGTEEYSVLLAGASDAGNTTITVSTGPTVTASALIGTPADIVASYTTSGANLALTVYVPQIYHTINFINQHLDTGLVRVNWED